MVIEYVDLHSHTTASDGTGPPARNVQLAKEAGLAGIAITDHDTVAGIDEALREGERLGIVVVPGVEISAVANQQDIHVLGYYMNVQDPVFLNRLALLRNTRNLRNDMIVERLQQLGMSITMDEVTASLGRVLQDKKTIGRPHIADLMINKGYVNSIAEAFDKYLGKQGAAYVNPPRIHPKEAIEWIKEAGGCAVLAHPGIYHKDELVEQLILDGLDGIEVYHSDHSDADEARYLEMALRHNLIITAGSDYHGERHGVVFHASIGSRKINATVLQQLKVRMVGDKNL
ncbi:MAG TPA: PHP domain-containing protein [Bacilli bacterium]